MHAVLYSQMLVIRLRNELRVRQPHCTSQIVYTQCLKGSLHAKWLFAQMPFDPPNHPKPPQTPNFVENLALPRNPPGIPTEFILTAILNSTEFP